MTLDGERRLTARVLVSATGGLSRPALPAIEGLSRFAGPVFHSARWRDDVPPPAETVFDGERAEILRAARLYRDGNPIVMLADHPVTGGYPVIAVVVDSQLDLAAQVPMGPALIVGALLAAWL